MRVKICQNCLQDIKLACSNAAAAAMIIRPCSYPPTYRKFSAPPKDLIPCTSPPPPPPLKKRGWGMGARTMFFSYFFVAKTWKTTQRLYTKGGKLLKLMEEYNPLCRVWLPGRGLAGVGCCSEGGAARQETGTWQGGPPRYQQLAGGGTAASREAPSRHPMIYQAAGGTAASWGPPTSVSEKVGTKGGSEGT